MTGLLETSVKKQKTDLSLDLIQEVFDGALPSAVASPIIATVILAENKFQLFQLSPVSFHLFYLVFIFNIFRLFVISASKSPPLKNDARLRRLTSMYATAVIGSAFSYTSLVVLFAATYGTNHPHTLLALLALAGITAGGSISLRGSLTIAKLFLLSTLVYIGAYFIALHQNSFWLGVLCILFGGFLYQQIKKYHTRLCELFAQREATQQEHAILRQVIDSMPARVSLIDENLNYVILNQPLLRSLGKSESEIVGKHVGVLDQDAEFVQSVMEFARSGNHSKQQKIMLNSELGTRWHWQNMRRLNAQGALICVTIDIHNELMLETRNKEAQAKLVQSAKMASLGEMASGLSHEINNPLSIIVGRMHLMADLVTEGAEGPVLMGEIKKVQSTASRISKIIRGLRTFARDSDKDPMTPIPLAQVVDDTLELCRERLKKQNIQLRVDITAGEEASIECRPSQLSQVLLNLLNNAHDAIESSDNKWIELHARIESSSCVITVTDSGHGIPDAVATKLMQPFFTTKELGKGTGLGLSISSGIIKEHGGTLRYNSSHANTQFEIVLPLVKSGERHVPTAS